MIYVACVMDNRKVKEYRRGMMGGGERNREEEDQRGGVAC